MVVDALNNQYKFTGKERDAESGLDYFIARYYASGWGRFMSTDPLFGNPANPQSLNRYAYSLNNPLRFIDPTGLQPKEKEAEKPTETKVCDEMDYYGHCIKFEKPEQANNDCQANNECGNMPGSFVEDPTQSQKQEKSREGQNLLALAATAAVLDSPAPGPADVIAAGIVATAIVIHFSKQKDTLQWIDARKGTISEHLDKIGSADPNDPNRRKWASEIRARLQEIEGKLKRLSDRAKKEVDSTSELFGANCRNDEENTIIATG